MWRIECKGLPEKGNTIWSDFCRGLGQAVSYFDSTPSLRLGLALPDDPNEEFRQYWSTRVTPALRARLNLWLLLYDDEKRGEESIRPVSPKVPICQFCGWVADTRDYDKHLRIEHPKGSKVYGRAKGKVRTSTRTKTRAEPARLRNVYVGGPWKDRASAEAKGERKAAQVRGAVFTVSRWGKKAVRYYVTVKAPQES